MFSRRTFLSAAAGFGSTEIVIVAVCALEVSVMVSNPTGLVTLPLGLNCSVEFAAKVTPLPEGVVVRARPVVAGTR